jgi:RDD family protein
MTNAGPEAERGVFYAITDYAGLMRRLFIDLVDFIVAMAISVVMLKATASVAPDLLDVPRLRLGALAAVWISYFVLLKASPYRTLGYVVGRVRIVNYRGERPGIPRLVGRLAFVLGGPLNFLFDAFWLTGDENRQALRDKFASTYVIRQNAVPAGWGRLRYRNYTCWGMTFMFREVQRVVA